MPCYVTGSYEGNRELDANETKKELKRVTRVACELARIVKMWDRNWAINNITGYMTSPTIKWVREHEFVDKKRRKRAHQCKTLEAIRTCQICSIP